MEMFQKMIIYTKSILESYVNDESGKDSKEKFESLKNEDFLNIYLRALEMSNMNVEDEDLQTNIVIVFDYYV